MVLLTYLWPKLWVLHTVWGWKYIVLVLCVAVLILCSVQQYILCGMSHVHGQCRKFHQSYSVELCISYLIRYTKAMCPAHWFWKVESYICYKMRMAHPGPMIDRHIHVPGMDILYFSSWVRLSCYNNGICTLWCMYPTCTHEDRYVSQDDLLCHGGMILQMHWCNHVIWRASITYSNVFLYVTIHIAPLSSYIKSDCWATPSC